jgi:hypothetical protein
LDVADTAIHWALGEYSSAKALTDINLVGGSGDIGISFVNGDGTGHASGVLAFPSASRSGSADLSAQYVSGGGAIRSDYWCVGTTTASLRIFKGTIDDIGGFAGTANTSITQPWPLFKSGSSYYIGATLVEGNRQLARNHRILGINVGADLIDDYAFWNVLTE